MYLKALLDFISPRKCIVCGRALGTRERFLCTHCRVDFPYTQYWERAHNPLADSYNALIQVNISESEPYSWAAALFFYKSTSGYREITRELKYRGNRAVGRAFAAQLGERLAGSPCFRDVDLVVPVPLHPSRRRSRGYNQAEVIAREVASCLKVPCDTTLLKRRRRTATQTHLDPVRRLANVSGSFCVSSSRNPDCRHILLVDDVFTTGATMAACHKALRTVLGKDVRISAATLACTGLY